jgi:hypothetical protein
MTEVRVFSLLRCGCGVSRFSCPENSIGNYANHSCGVSNGRSALDMKKNKNNHIVTGTIKHVQSDRLCDYLEDCIPFYCQCDQDQTGTQAVLKCSVSLFVVIYSHDVSPLLRCKLLPASEGLVFGHKKGICSQTERRLLPRKVTVQNRRGGGSGRSGQSMKKQFAIVLRALNRPLSDLETMKHEGSLDKFYSTHEYSGQLKTHDLYALLFDLVVNNQSVEILAS